MLVSYRIIFPLACAVSVPYVGMEKVQAGFHFVACPIESEITFLDPLVPSETRMARALLSTKICDDGDEKLEVSYCLQQLQLGY